MKYLYGLSIQGIQGYIFETSKLKEVVGASELVASLPEKIIHKIVGKELDSSNLLINAAGNFRYVFEDEETCKNVFANVPKVLRERAGNVTVSQAVVKVGSDQIESQHLNELVQKLQVQRNKPKKQLGIGLMGVKKVQRTGNLQVNFINNEAVDYNQKIKRKASSKNQLLDIVMKDEDPLRSRFTNDLEEIAEPKYQNWIAVIHADGNGLGKKITKMSAKLKSTQEGFKDLSIKLDEATKSAVRKAFDDTIRPKISDEENLRKIPFRPVIVGGDDVTVITRGDLAFDFTVRFLEYFEAETQNSFSTFDQKFGLENIFSSGLTACAGISFIKSHYPFHYGVDMAGELCDHAKLISKIIATESGEIPSSLMFHKVHSSFVGEWEEIVEKGELMAGETSLLNGPYFLRPNEHFDSVSTLKKWVQAMQSVVAPKGSIRQWLTMLGDDPKRADDLLKRTKQTMRAPHLWDDLDMDITLRPLHSGRKKTHLYDVLTLEDIITAK